MSGDGVGYGSRRLGVSDWSFFPRPNTFRAMASGWQPLSPFSRLSIRVKLPLTIGSLVLVVGLALSTASFFAMRRILLDRGAERLVTLRNQFAETFRTSVSQNQHRLLVQGRDPAILEYLKSPTSANAAGALAAMDYEGPQPELSLAMELRDPSGKILLSTAPSDRLGPPLPSLGEGDSASILAVFPDLAGMDSMASGRLREDGDSIAYPVVARIAGPVTAYLVNWRRVSTAPQTRAVISRILGSEATFNFGNRDGTVWTDLGRMASPPPAPIEPGAAAIRYTRPTGEVMATAGTADGTPWIFTIEFPLTAILAPGHLFLNRLVLIALLALTIGLAVAWYLSGWITDPLATLTSAANAMTRGELGARAGLHRDDELGALGASFDAMAAEIEGTRKHLEETVATRTRQLENTQESLVRREKLATLGQLASGVAHELRNPLGVINNAVFYLDSVQTEAPPQIQEYHQIIHRQVTLATKIINDLLDFARKPPANLRTVPLDHIVTPQLKEISLNGVRLEQDFPPTLPQVIADPDHAGQVVYNLVTNAVQAMGDSGGILSIRGRSDGNGFVCLEVSDTGPGHSRREPGADLRAALHHQDPGHRPRPLGVPHPGQGQRRRSHRLQQPRPGRHLRLHAAHRELTE